MGVKITHNLVVSWIWLQRRKEKFQSSLLELLKTDEGAVLNSYKKETLQFRSGESIDMVPCLAVLVENHFQLSTSWCQWHQASWMEGFQEDNQMANATCIDGESLHCQADLLLHG